MTHSTFDAPASKTCTKCGESKPLTEYYQRKSGPRQGEFSAYCRACSVAAVMASRAKNPEAHTKIRDSMRRWRAENREIAIARERARYIAQTEKRRKVAQKARRKNPLRTQAHNAIRRAVRHGKFPPASSMVCKYCQEAQAADWHHHRGYEKQFWLDVVAVCNECHGKAHRVNQ